jgi:hypothetical protein
MLDTGTPGRGEQRHVPVRCLAEELLDHGATSPRPHTCSPHGAYLTRCPADLHPAPEFPPPDADDLVPA